MAETQDVEIVALGAQGDGIAQTEATPVYIPYALPGERWRIAVSDLPVLVRAHPERVGPVCSHFGSCGGCVAQHMPDAMYAAWKGDIVVSAFRHRGIEAPVDDLVAVPLASRRRLTLHAKRMGAGLSLGFHRTSTHDVLNVSECPIAVSQLVAVLPALREILEPIVANRAEAAIELLATPIGIDANIAFTHLDAARKDIPRMAALAVQRGLARLAIAGEVIMMARQPSLEFGGVPIVPPPAAFAQAVEASEGEMVRLVLAATAKAKRVADLFCGLGTFTFPMARRAPVLAVDASKTAIDALVAGARHAQGLKPIEAKVRDLFRVPMGARELDGIDAVVFDPARSGAQAQCEQLARSKVPAVVAVSCNPGTLARDVRILIDGGYTLERVTPIDQFLYAAHVEAVAVLRR